MRVCVSCVRACVLACTHACVCASVSVCLLACPVPARLLEGLLARLPSQCQFCVCLCLCLCHSASKAGRPSVSVSVAVFLSVSLAGRLSGCLAVCMCVRAHTRACFIMCVCACAVAPKGSVAVWALGLRDINSMHRVVWISSRHAYKSGSVERGAYSPAVRAELRRASEAGRCPVKPPTVAAQATEATASEWSEAFAPLADHITGVLVVRPRWAAEVSRLLGAAERQMQDFVCVSGGDHFGQIENPGTTLRAPGPLSGSVVSSENVFVHRLNFDPSPLDSGIWGNVERVGLGQS